MIDKSSAIPLYFQIKQALLDIIKHHEDEGQPLPPETGLARQYGVSIMTVRQAFAELVNEGVVRRIPGKGTFVVRKKWDTVRSLGLVIYDVSRIEHLFFAGIAQGIKEEMSERGHHSLFISTFKEDAFYDELVVKQAVDGLIIVGQEMNPDDVERWKKRGFRFLLLFYPHKVADVTRITADFQHALFEQVDYLMRLGHRRIAFVGGLLHLALDQQKLAGYRAALERYGIPYDGSLVVDAQYDFKLAVQMSQDLLRRSDRPTAIVATDDIMAMGVLKGARELGLAVPQECSVTGFGNMNVATVSDPPLTTSDMELNFIGRSAAQALYSLIAGDAVVKKDFVIKPRLIVRESAVAL